MGWIFGYLMCALAAYGIDAYCTGRSFEIGAKIDRLVTIFGRRFVSAGQRALMLPAYHCHCRHITLVANTSLMLPTPL